jgi:hypothetical protein
MDVLAPGTGEIIGGSQREERLEVLDRSMAERGIDREHYAWYPDLRRYGTVPQLLPNPPPLATSSGGGRGGASASSAPSPSHRLRQRARRDPLPAHPRQRAVLTRNYPIASLSVATKTLTTVIVVAT